MTASAAGLVVPASSPPRAGRRVLPPRIVSLVGVRKAFAFGIVFVAGWYLCLPETDLVELPWFAVKHKIANVLVHEFLFAGFVVLGGMSTVVARARTWGYMTLPVSVGIAVLAVWCAMTSLLAPYPMHDAGRSARLILMALYLLAVTDWAASNPLFVLRTFLSGLLASSVVNLVLTILNPVIMAAGIVPRLLGQNSPGPPMGIAVCLSAWLVLTSRNRRDAALALVVAVVCGAGALISYSKTGMLAAVMGFASMGLIAARVSPSRRGKVVIGSLLVVAVSIGAFLVTDGGQPIRRGIALMIQEKVASAQPGQSTSVNERWSYVVGVTEIVAKNPLGVGFSGFREAMMETEAYASGHAADETFIPADESNPHSMFLYYASAGGIPAFLLTVLTFVLMCRSLLAGMSLYGIPGIVIASLCCVAYAVLATSVIYLFNSSVMIIPAALSAGICAHVRARQLQHAPAHA